VDRDRLQAPALGSERVLDAWRPGVDDATLEHARLLELDESLRQRPRRDLPHRLLELVEA